MPAAFPGAYGWGAGTPGGRGGDVYHVTNLNNSGGGSLRSAVEASGPRIVIFDVAGVINLSGTLNFNNPYLTIAGQTAPGGGIVLTGDRFVMESHDLICRYISWMNDGSGNQSGFTVYEDAPGFEIHDLIFDHCTGLWPTDDLIDMWHEFPSSPDYYNITYQKCIFAEPPPSHATLTNIGCQEPAHTSCDKIHHLTFYRNLFANCGWRNPLIAARHSEVVNNVVYNWAWYIMGFHRDSEVDFIGNFGKRQGTQSPGTGHLFVQDSENAAETAQIYAAGNIVPDRFDDPGADNWEYFRVEGSSTDQPDSRHKRNPFVPLASAPNPVPVLTATEAYQAVIAEAGNSHRLNADGSLVFRQDAETARIRSDVINATGPVGNGTSRGTIPPIDAGTPYVDFDDDGMPDEWESINGVSDPNGHDLDPDYTNMEVFLNGNVVVDPPPPPASGKFFWFITDSEFSISELKALDDTLDAAAKVIKE